MSTRSNFSSGMIMASAAVLLAFLAAWQWLPGLAGVPEFILPPPTKVWGEFLRMLGSEKLMFHTGITALEVVVGFVLGSLLGVLIGFSLWLFMH